MMTWTGTFRCRTAVPDCAVRANKWATAETSLGFSSGTSLLGQTQSPQFSHSLHIYNNSLSSVMIQISSNGDIVTDVYKSRISRLLDHIKRRSSISSGGHGSTADSDNRRWPRWSDGRAMPAPKGNPSDLVREDDIFCTLQLWHHVAIPVLQTFTASPANR